MENLAQIRSLIDFIVKSIVENKDNVTITESKDEDCYIFKVDVDEADVGKVIGKHGKIAQSIRTLVYGMNKTGEKITIKFSEKM